MPSLPTGRRARVGILSFPPVLWLLSLPIFDIIAVLQPLTKANWALGLMIVPVMIPVIFSFLMIFGYGIVFLGHMLVASSLGENDHPDWPEWHPADIAEGFMRLDLALAVGLLVGAGPLARLLVQLRRNRRVRLPGFACLIMMAAGFGQMGLAARSSTRTSSPQTHSPWSSGSFASAGPTSGHASWPASRWRAPFWALAACSTRCPTCGSRPWRSWAYWVLVFYLGMVSIRMMGLTYHAHANDLGWFRRGRAGRLRGIMESCTPTRDVTPGEARRSLLSLCPMDNPFRTGPSDTPRRI